MARNMITVLPVLVAFLAAQKTLIQSLTRSAVKG
jgi:multiple sugar transport system permease protein